MKIRLEGTKEEIEDTLKRLEPIFLFVASTLYPNRDGKTYRCYLAASVREDGNQPKHDDAVLGGNN